MEGPLLEVILLSPKFHSSFRINKQNPKIPQFVSHYLSIHGWTLAFLLDVHRLCATIAGSERVARV